VTSLWHEADVIFSGHLPCYALPSLPLCTLLQAPGLTPVNFIRQSTRFPERIFLLCYVHQPYCICCSVLLKPLLPLTRLSFGLSAHLCPGGVRRRVFPGSSFHTRSDSVLSPPFPPPLPARHKFSSVIEPFPWLLVLSVDNGAEVPDTFQFLRPDSLSG